VVARCVEAGEVQMRWWCLQRERRDVVVLMVARAWFRWCAEMENGDGGGASRWRKVELLVRESRRWSETTATAVEVDGGG